MAGNIEEMALVRRCVEGDRAAWRTLMTNYGALVAHAVRETFRRILKQVDSNRVDDAIQSVWFSLCEDGCRRLRGFRSKSRLSTWLTVLSTRRALDILRSERRRGTFKNVHFDDEDRDLIKELQAPETERRFSPDDVFLLYDSLERLPEEDKLILKMYYLDGFSYHSIAVILKVTANTISSYLLRAREKLKRCMTEGSGGVQ